MSAIWLIAGVALFVWGTCFVLRGSLVAGCLLLLLLMACFGHPLVNFDAGPLPLTLDRVWLAALAVAYGIQRRLGRAEPKRLGAAEWLLLALMVLLAVSTFTHEWRASLPGQVPPIWRLVGGYLTPLAVYWFARQSPLTERKVMLVHGALACFGIYLAVTGLLEVNQQWAWVFPKYIADPTLGIHFGRARGPLLQAGTYGMFVGVCCLSAWLWRTRWGRCGQLGWLMSLPLSLAAVYASYTRSVWLGVGVGLLIVLGLTLDRAWRPLVIGGLMAAALLLVVTRWDSLLAFNREQSATDTRESAYMRASFSYVSWLMFLDRPLLGCGFGQYSLAQNNYLSDRSTSLHLESLRGYAHHNTLLSLLTETGALGLGLFLAVLTLWTRQAWRLVRCASAPDWSRSHAVLLLGTLGIYACQMLAYEVSFSPLENSLVFFLAGINSGLQFRWAAAANPASLPSALGTSEHPAFIPDRHEGCPV